MTPQARVIWDAVEFRMPAVLKKAGGLTDGTLLATAQRGQLGCLAALAHRRSRGQLARHQPRSVQVHRGRRSRRLLVPNRPGLAICLSDQAAAWTAERASFGKRA